MLNALTLIFCCQLAGEFLIGATGIPVPGPVIGMVLLFSYLFFKGHVPQDMARVGDGLLNHLSLLFVPAGVGIMLHFELLGEDMLAIGIALVVSTVSTVIITALLMRKLTANSKTKKAAGDE
jgi:holin-like protein